MEFIKTYEIKVIRDYSVIVMYRNNMYEYYLSKNEYGNLLEMFAVEKELSIEQIYENVIDNIDNLASFWIE